MSLASTLRDWRERAKRLLHAPGPGAQAPPLRVHRVADRAAYREHIARHGATSWDLENALAAAHPDQPFQVQGRCWVDNARVAFDVDYLYAAGDGTRKFPNWRERLLCPVCGLNNRQRASVHLATESLGLRPGSRIYMTEQVTPAYTLMRRRHANLVGSEFLGDDAAPGSVNAAGIRHEDLTRLSFPDGEFDAILTFDVLEHIPDYRKALAECRRVLAPGGQMLFSIPFMEDAPATRTRAHFDPNGELVHDHPPAYHGDPVNPERGVLCFHDFGWDVLDHAREAGFTDATALLYRDPGYGYLGGWPIVFTARRG